MSKIPEMDFRRRLLSERDYFSNNISIFVKNFRMEHEREILDRLAGNDRNAFDAIYLFYAPKIEEMAFWMLKNRSEAEDVMQSVMLKVWERRIEIAQMEHFSNYLFVMTKHAIFDIYNRSLRHGQYKAYLSTVRYFQDDTLDNEVEANDLSLLISIAVERMPDQRRRIFRMSRYEGLSNREIAQKLQISVKTVESHMTAALNQLRQLLGIMIFFF